MAETEMNRHIYFRELFGTYQCKIRIELSNRISVSCIGIYLLNSVRKKDCVQMTQCPFEDKRQDIKILY